eukprot:scaffold1085_cov252-Pinguiococcus_pyrenoidosus.AAC.10
MPLSSPPLHGSTSELPRLPRTCAGKHASSYLPSLRILPPFSDRSALAACLAALLVFFVWYSCSPASVRVRMVAGSAASALLLSMDGKGRIAEASTLPGKLAKLLGILRLQRLHHEVRLIPSHVCTDASLEWQPHSRAASA